MLGPIVHAERVFYLILEYHVGESGLRRRWDIGKTQVRRTSISQQMAEKCPAPTPLEHMTSNGTAFWISLWACFCLDNRRNSYLGNGALPYKHADGTIHTASDKTTRGEKGQIVPEISLQMKSEEIRVVASLRLSHDIHACSLCVQLRPVFVLLKADPLEHIIMLNRLPHNWTFHAQFLLLSKIFSCSPSPSLSRNVSNSWIAFWGPTLPNSSRCPTRGRDTQLRKSPIACACDHLRLYGHGVADTVFRRHPSVYGLSIEA